MDADGNADAGGRAIALPGLHSKMDVQILGQVWNVLYGANVIPIPIFI